MCVGVRDGNLKKINKSGRGMPWPHAPPLKFLAAEDVQLTIHGVLHDGYLKSCRWGVIDEYNSNLHKLGYNTITYYNHL